MEWMLLPLKRYAQFSGRSRRKEFWLWVLLLLVVTFVLSLLDQALGLGGRTSTYSQATPGLGMSAGANVRGGVLTGLFSLAVLIPNLAVSVRRLHDTDRTGWWILLPAAPYAAGIAFGVVGAINRNMALIGVAGILVFVGVALAIVLLVFYCLPGTRGPNRYGDDPLGQTTDQLAATFD